MGLTTKFNLKSAGAPRPLVAVNKVRIRSPDKIDDRADILMCDPYWFIWLAPTPRTPSFGVESAVDKTIGHRLVDLPTAQMNHGAAFGDAAPQTLVRACRHNRATLHKR